MVPPNDLPSLADLRRRRLRAGLSQTELARRAGVSQSLVAKIERGRIDPSYRKALALFEALDRHLEAEPRDVPVRHLATPALVHVEPSTLLVEAARRLRRHSISQVPVLSGGLVVGSLTDRTIVRCLADPRSVSRLARLTVGEVLEGPFPQIDADTPSRVAAALLRHVPAVLVTERGTLRGIVTQSDLFKAL